MESQRKKRGGGDPWAQPQHVAGPNAKTRYPKAIKPGNIFFYPIYDIARISNKPSATNLYLKSSQEFGLLTELNVSRHAVTRFAEQNPFRSSLQA